MKERGPSRRRRRGIHPQLREGFEMLHEELRNEGMSNQEAHQRLMTNFDWGLNELIKPVLRDRTDEFAGTEADRDFEAEANRDLAAQWLEAYYNGSHVFMENLLGLRRDEI